jgi:hypothetical protein
MSTTERSEAGEGKGQFKPMICPAAGQNERQKESA